MKKLIIIILICTFGREGFCSTANLTNQLYINQKTDSLPTGNEAKKTRMEDYVIIQAGKLVLVVNNKNTPAKEDVTMQDGSVVRMDGTLITKEGKTYVLHEGDKVYMSGLVEAPKIQ